MQYFTEKIKEELLHISNDKNHKHYRAINKIIDDINKNKYPYKKITRMSIEYNDENGIVFNNSDVTNSKWMYEKYGLHKIIDLTDIDDEHKYVSIDIIYFYSDEKKFNKDKQQMIDLSLELDYDEENLLYFKNKFKKHFKKNLRKEKINKLSKK